MFLQEEKKTVYIPKSHNQLNITDNADEDIFMKSIHDRYIARPEIARRLMFCILNCNI